MKRIMLAQEGVNQIILNRDDQILEIDNNIFPDLIIPLVLFEKIRKDYLEHKQLIFEEQIYAGITLKIVKNKFLYLKNGANRFKLIPLTLFIKALKNYQE